MARGAIQAFYQRFCEPRLQRFENPVAAQERCLRNILKRCKNTVFGRRYGFSDIKSVKDFQRRVPVTTYERMQPYISRCANGEQNVLFPDRVIIFLATSGTAGTSKYFPLGEYRIREFLRDSIIGAAFYIVQSGNYEIIDGAVLTIAAAQKLGQKIGEYDAAHFSGAIPNALRSPQMQIPQIKVSSRRVPPPEVDEIDDWEEKAYLTARYSVAADVRSSSGVTSKVVSQLLRTKRQYLDRLLKDPKLDEKTKVRLREASSDGDIDLKEIWPNFIVFGAGGVSLTPYRRMIHDLLGDVDIWESYGATEASMGLQIWRDKGIIAMVDRTFFEFIEEDKVETEPIPLSDVKRNTLYRVLITNSAGFYRYELGDLVSFSNLDPPVFDQICRKNALVDVVQERMSEEVFLRVLTRACEQFEIGFVDFALLPEVTEEGSRHILFIEFTELPSDLEEFTSVVDHRLGMAHHMYFKRRKHNHLSRPVIIPVQPGGFEQMLRHLGKDPVQGKVPRLLTLKLSQMIPQLKSSPS
ncbi:MAG: GH3 auxin-responsive promoter family protein [Promethearchaeota archaeon]